MSLGFLGRWCSAPVVAGFLAASAAPASAPTPAPTPAPANGPVINEFSPRPAGGEGEWIELFNPGPTPVALTGWHVHDGTGRERALPEIVLGGGRYLVLAARPDSLRAYFALADSVRVLRPDGWPTLNDRDGSGGAPADWIVVTDATGATADSVAYFEAWLPEARGRSMERVAPDGPSGDPGSWGWSLDPAGGTPGTVNSLGRNGGDRGENRLWGPTEVAPGRGPAVFGFRFPGPGTLAFRLVDREGREIAVLRPPAPAPAAGEWVWGSGAPAPPRSGPYFLCCHWQGEGHGRLLRDCLSLWVAR